MRDLALLLATLFFLPVSLRYPAAGLLCWTWFSIMNPHRQVYGFAFGQPFNSVIAVATIIGWLASRERKRWSTDAAPWVILCFVGWMTLATAFSPYPEFAWMFWDRTVRIFALVFLVFFLMTTKARIHGLVWVIVISLGFYGIKGGVFTLAQGGHAIVYGPPDSVYYDNNQLALAIVVSLPLVYYLWRHTRAAWLRIPMVFAMGLEVLMVFGSYSRGGVIALGAMMSMLWLRSDRKILLGLLALAMVGGGLSMMPASFFDRLHTVNSLDSDDSFQGRLDAWEVAAMAAAEHFPFGVGFNVAQIKTVFNSYLPGAGVHAAHSIYFQVLGDHGYIGLGLYVTFLLLALRNAGIVRRQTQDQPELAWANDLADMLRVSLISFYIGGAALSMAYADEYLLIIALLSSLRQLTQPATLAAAQQERKRRRAMSFGQPSGAEPAR